MIRNLTIALLVSLVAGCIDIPGVTAPIPGVPGGPPLLDRSTVYEEDTPEDEGTPEGPDMSALLARLGENMQAPALSVDPKDLVVGRYAEWVSGDAVIRIACVGARGLNKIVEYSMGAKGAERISFAYYVSPGGKAVKAFIQLPGMGVVEAKVTGSEAIPLQEQAAPPPGVNPKKVQISAAGRTFDAYYYASPDGTAKVWASDDVYFWPVVKVAGPDGSFELSEMGNDAKPTVPLP